jgi:hypothetical protein
MLSVRCFLVLGRTVLVQHGMATVELQRQKNSTDNRTPIFLIILKISLYATVELLFEILFKISELQCPTVELHYATIELQ